MWEKGEGGFRRSLPENLARDFLALEENEKREENMSVIRKKTVRVASGFMFFGTFLPSVERRKYAVF